MSQPCPGFSSSIISDTFSHSRHLQAGPHRRPELWHSQYFFKQWLFWHLHLITISVALPIKSGSLLPQAKHSQSLVQARPNLKHQQQFFWQRVLVQKHLLVGASDSAQVEVDVLEVLSSVVSVSSMSWEGMGAGWQSQLREDFLDVFGSATSCSSKSWPSSFSYSPSSIIMICSSFSMISGSYPYMRLE